MVNFEKILTIDSIDNISNEALERFMHDGFAYVKVASSSFENKISELEKIALQFFHQPKTIKEKNKRDPETFQGYIDKRTSGRKIELVEQMTFSVKQPLGLFAEYKSVLDEIHEVYYSKIIKPLLKAIFYRVLQSHGLSDVRINELYSETIHDIFFLMSLLFYPYWCDSEQSGEPLSGHIVQPAHVDEGLFTIIRTNQEGLQVWLDEGPQNQHKGAWYNVSSRPGYVTINIGQALSLILSGKCNAVKHRVLLPKADRLSIGVFYNPPITFKLRDFIENKLLFEGSYEEYIKDYFSHPFLDTDSTLAA